MPANQNADFRYYTRPFEATVDERSFSCTDVEQIADCLLDYDPEVYVYESLCSAATLRQIALYSAQVIIENQLRPNTVVQLRPTG